MAGVAAEPPAPRPTIAFNSALNLAGYVAPVVAAIIAFPLLNRFLGTDRVGFLTLAWALVGYAGLLDFGLGRALTQMVADRAGSAARETLPGMVWTALAIMLGVGTAAALVMAFGARWLVVSALNIPLGLQAEAVSAVRILAATVPLVVSSAGLRGVLEGQCRFGMVNVVRAPLGVWLVVGPLLVVPFGTRSLAAIALALLVGRACAWMAYAAFVVRTLPGSHLPAFDRRHIPSLLRFGGWMTVTNVVSPLLVYLDRFVVSTQVSLDAVAWYSVPSEIVTKILIVPGAFVGVLFPVFSGLLKNSAPEAARLYRSSLRFTAIMLFLPCFAGALFAREALGLWVGADFANHSYRVTQLVAFGALCNGIAYIPFALIQGAGRPDVTARILAAELPVYVALLFGLTYFFGIDGAATAWALRMLLDLALLSVFARRALPALAAPSAWWGVAVVAASLACGGAMLSLGLYGKGMLLAAVLGPWAALTYNTMRNPEGRLALQSRVPSSD